MRQGGVSACGVGAFTAIAALLMFGGPATAQQAVPEVVRPRTDAPALPPGKSEGAAPQPRSENPLTDGGGAKPVPDSGVVAPPNPAVGSPMVIKPPATGSMPVIPPPGTPGGDRTVVPK